MVEHNLYAPQEIQTTVSGNGVLNVHVGYLLLKKVGYLACVMTPFI